MVPEKLTLLMIEDLPMTKRFNLFNRLYLNVSQFKSWREFCQRLINHEVPTFHLLTIDFCFNEDQSSPPRGDAGSVHEDYLDEEYLDELAWSPHLRWINSGVLMGATMVNLGLYRDIPIGAAVHTGYPDLVKYDMTTAMLVTQILASCGADLDCSRTAELLRGTVKYVLEGPTSCLTAIPTALQRFRSQFLQRSKVNGPKMLIINGNSTGELLNQFLSVESDDELDQLFEEKGLRFYDQSGVEHHIDLRSMFTDLLIKIEKFAGEDDLHDILRKLPYTSVKEGGCIRDFIEQLDDCSVNFGEIADYFDSEVGVYPDVTLSSRFSSPRIRLIVMLIAWCKAWKEKQNVFYGAWNVCKNRPTDIPYGSSLITILKRFLEFLEDHVNNGHEIPPATIQGKKSIVDLISDYAEDHPNTVLAKTLLCHMEGTSNQRQDGVKYLVNHLEKSRCLKAIKKGKEIIGYKLTSTTLSLKADITRKDVGRYLGCSESAAHNTIGRIIVDAGLEEKSFWNSLSEKPLPAWLRIPVLKYCEDDGEILTFGYRPPCLDD